MTGGQMAPTTLVGQVTATTPKGRDLKDAGSPLKISEIIASLPAVTYVERTAASSPQQILKTKKAIKQAFENQIKGIGFSLVEVLSPCPTYWGVKPKQAMDWIENTMTKQFPLGRLK